MSQDFEYFQYLKDEVEDLVADDDEEGSSFVIPNFPAPVGASPSSITSPLTTLSPKFRNSRHSNSPCPPNVRHNVHISSPKEPNLQPPQKHPPKTLREAVKDDQLKKLQNQEKNQKSSRQDSHKSKTQKHEVSNPLSVSPQSGAQSAKKSPLPKNHANPNQIGFSMNFDSLLEEDEDCEENRPSFKRINNNQKKSLNLASNFQTNQTKHSTDSSKIEEIKNSVILNAEDLVLANASETLFDFLGDLEIEIKNLEEISLADFSPIQLPQPPSESTQEKNPISAFTNETTANIEYHDEELPDFTCLFENSPQINQKTGLKRKKNNFEAFDDACEDESPKKKRKMGDSQNSQESFVSIEFQFEEEKATGIERESQESFEKPIEIAENEELNNLQVSEDENLHFLPQNDEKNEEKKINIERNIIIQTNEEYFSQEVAEKIPQNLTEAPKTTENSIPFQNSNFVDLEVNNSTNTEDKNAIFSFKDQSFEPKDVAEAEPQFKIQIFNEFEDKIAELADFQIYFDMKEDNQQENNQKIENFDEKFQFDFSPEKIDEKLDFEFKPTLEHETEELNDPKFDVVDERIPISMIDTNLEQEKLKIFDAENEQEFVISEVHHEENDENFMKQIEKSIVSCNFSNYNVRSELNLKENSSVDQDLHLIDSSLSFLQTMRIRRLFSKEILQEEEKEEEIEEKPIENAEKEQENDMKSMKMNSEIAEDPKKVENSHQKHVCESRNEQEDKNLAIENILSDQQNKTEKQSNSFHCLVEQSTTTSIIETENRKIDDIDSSQVQKIEKKEEDNFECQNAAISSIPSQIPNKTEILKEEIESAKAITPDIEMNKSMQAEEIDKEEVHCLENESKNEEISTKIENNNEDQNKKQENSMEIEKEASIQIQRETTNEPKIVSIPPCVQFFCIFDEIILEEHIRPNFSIPENQEPQQQFNTSNLLSSNLDQFQIENHDQKNSTGNETVQNDNDDEVMQENSAGNEDIDKQMELLIQYKILQIEIWWKIVSNYRKLKKNGKLEQISPAKPIAETREYAPISDRHSIQRYYEEKGAISLQKVWKMHRVKLRLQKQQKSAKKIQKWFKISIILKRAKQKFQKEMKLKREKQKLTLKNIFSNYHQATHYSFQRKINIIPNPPQKQNFIFPKPKFPPTNTNTNKSFMSIVNNVLQIEKNEKKQEIEKQKETLKRKEYPENLENQNKKRKIDEKLSNEQIALKKKPFLKSEKDLSLEEKKKLYLLQAKFEILNEDIMKIESESKFIQETEKEKTENQANLNSIKSILQSLLEKYAEVSSSTISESFAKFDVPKKDFGEKKTKKVITSEP